MYKSMVAKTLFLVFLVQHLLKCRMIQYSGLAVCNEVVVYKGVGPSTALAWPGWKQFDIPVEVDTALLETSRTDTVKELPGYSIQNCPSGSFLF